MTTSAGIVPYGMPLTGLDHGVGHSLLLLYDAKAPRGQKSKKFNDLGHDPSNASTSLFYIMTKYFIFITPIGKPPPLAVRLAEALPFRRA